MNYCHRSYGLNQFLIRCLRLAVSGSPQGPSFECQGEAWLQGERDQRSSETCHASIFRITSGLFIWQGLALRHGQSPTGPHVFPCSLIDVSHQRVFFFLRFCCGKRSNPLAALSRMSCVCKRFRWRHISKLQDFKNSRPIGLSLCIKNQLFHQIL